MTPRENIRDLEDNRSLISVEKEGPDLFRVKLNGMEDVVDNIFLQIESGDILLLNEDHEEQLRVTNSNLPLREVLSGWMGGICNFSYSRDSTQLLKK